MVVVEKDGVTRSHEFEHLGRTSLRVVCVPALPVARIECPSHNVQPQTLRCPPKSRREPASPVDLQVARDRGCAGAVRREIAARLPAARPGAHDQGEAQLAGRSRPLALHAKRTGAILEGLTWAPPTTPGN